MKLPPLPIGYGERMPRYEEETLLRSCGVDAFGREVRLASGAVEAWLAMQDQAGRERITLLLLSGFRSIPRQSEIVENKLRRGRSLNSILHESAYPGYSEHHTGRAVDIGASGFEHFSESFEHSPEFDWLSHHASRFGFALSYPRGNAQGISYEPWHWYRRDLPPPFGLR